jgi:hypothetical protein
MRPVTLIGLTVVLNVGLTALLNGYAVSLEVKRVGSELGREEVQTALRERDLVLKALATEIKALKEVKK